MIWKGGEKSTGVWGRAWRGSKPTAAGARRAAGFSGTAVPRETAGSLLLDAVAAAAAAVAAAAFLVFFAVVLLLLDLDPPDEGEAK